MNPPLVLKPWECDETLVTNASIDTSEFWKQGSHTGPVHIFQVL